MEHSKDQGSPFLTIGFSSLLVIFLILCMVIFAVLALSDARNNLQLSEQLLAKKEAYFEAVNKSEEILAQIDQILISCQGEKSSYLDAVEKQFEQSNFQAYAPAFSKNEQEATIQFSINYDDDTYLQITLSIPANSADANTRYQIKGFQTINTHNWIPKSNKKYQ